MAKDQDIFVRRIIRRARPAAQGSVMNTANAGGSLSSPEIADEVITDSGEVKRLWTPGDPWDDHYYFGGRP